MEERGQAMAATNATAGSSPPADARPGPTWRGWAVSILAAILLSAAVTLLLGGDFPFWSDFSGGASDGRAAFCPCSAAEKDAK